jgi:uncharacterized membrane-anchored protein
MNDWRDRVLSKVPEVTFTFWVIKILATTLGETGGDSVTMTLLHADKDAHNGGYLIGTALFFSVLVALVIWQVAAKRFHPFLYWATIVASTTAGTTMADFADRSLGIGYTGGSSLLLACVLAVLALWYWSQGTISVDTVTAPKVEAFYWAAITFRRPLGPHSATGWPTRPASAMRAARWCSPPGWRSSPGSTSGATCRVSCCSGPPSS